VFANFHAKHHQTIKRLGHESVRAWAGLQEKLDELKQSLLEYDVALEVRLNGKLHDREVRLDHGRTIKVSRGLDFYQKPEGWYAVGASDLSLRRCLETKDRHVPHPI
jgi:ATP-dependent Lon protease